MRVVITSAAGQILIQIAKEFAEAHELILIDRVSVPGKKSLVVDHAVNDGNSATRWLKVGINLGAHCLTERMPCPR